MSFKSAKDLSETVDKMEKDEHDQWKKIPNDIRTYIVNDHYRKIAENLLKIDDKSLKNKNIVDTFNEKLLELEQTNTDWAQIPREVREQQIHLNYTRICKSQLESHVKKTTPKPKEKVKKPVVNPQLEPDHSAEDGSHPK